jgi:hypothetical protein
MLKQTKKLMAHYGKKLMNGSITDKELKKLMHPDSFKPHGDKKGFVNAYAPVSDQNHTRQDAMNDFVLAIGPKLKPEVLHQLTARMICFSKDEGENTFMRTSVLEKAFLSYEMARLPSLSAQFFMKIEGKENKTQDPEYQARVKIQSKIEDFKIYKDIILSPLISFYEEHKKDITSHYPHGSGGRSHFFKYFFKVSSSQFENLDPSLKGLKGDALKSKILLNLKKELLSAKTQADVNQIEANFKNKDEFRALATPQGPLASTFKEKMSALKAVDELIDQRKQDISAEENSVKMRN